MKLVKRFQIQRLRLEHLLLWQSKRMTILKQPSPTNNLPQGLSETLINNIPNDIT